MRHEVYVSQRCPSFFRARPDRGPITNRHKRESDESSSPPTGVVAAGSMHHISNHDGADTSNGGIQAKPAASQPGDESPSCQPRAGPDASAVRMALRLVHMPPEKSTQLSAAYVERFGKKREPSFVRSVPDRQPQQQQGAANGHANDQAPMPTGPSEMLRDCAGLSAGFILGNSEICPDDVCAGERERGGAVCHLPAWQGGWRGTVTTSVRAAQALATAC